MGCGHRRCRWTAAPCIVVLLLVSVGAGCGYMPRTANQMSSDLDARDQALRDEIGASKQELLLQIQEAAKCLADVDKQLADLKRSMDTVRELEITLQSVRADMTAVRDDIRRVREDLRASVRREIGDALMDAGRNLQGGTAP
jgi:septal ring factor EnvC (AmiA/AmiB activator)